jgi:hypothetical protein
VGSFYTESKDGRVYRISFIRIVEDFFLNDRSMGPNRNSLMLG